jgi:hypothetical protein
MLAAKFEAIFPHLDERQRRLLMGAEARALGHGGIRPLRYGVPPAKNSKSDDLRAGIAQPSQPADAHTQRSGPSRIDRVLGQIPFRDCHGE